MDMYLWYEYWYEKVWVVRVQVWRGMGGTRAGMGGTSTGMNRYVWYRYGEVVWYEYRYKQVWVVRVQV